MSKKREEREGGGGDPLRALWVQERSQKLH